MLTLSGYRRRTRLAAAAAVPTTVLAALTLIPLSASGDGDHWVIDDEHFSIAFEVSHAGYAQQFGMFLNAEGEFVYDEEADELHSGEVTIQSDSVFTNHEERDNHVRDDDFLHVEEYPKMHFRATDYDPKAGTLYGEFTLLGTTRDIELDITINRIEEYPIGGGILSSPPYVLGASLRGTIKRSEYGMTYALEDELVGDEVDIILEFEARRQD